MRARGAYVALWLAITGGLVFPAGQQPQQAAKANFQGVTLNVIGHNSVQTDVTFKVIIPQWERDTGAKVQTSTLGAGDINSKLLVEFVAKSGAYDVVNASDVPLVYRGLEPLKPFIDDPKKTPVDYDFGDFMPYHIQTISSYQDTLYLAPWRSDVRWLYYRKDVLANAGLRPAELWSDHIENSRKLNNPPTMYGVVTHGRQYSATISVFSEMLWSHGGDYLNAKMEPMFQLQPGVDALNVWTKLLEYTPPDRLNYGAAEVVTAFVQGKAAMAHLWPMLAGTAQDPTKSQVVGKWDAALMPHAPGFKSVTASGGWGFGIARDSKNKDAAWDLVRFMTTKKAEKEIILNGGEANPVRRSTLADPEVTSKFFHFPIMLKAFENARGNPRMPEWAQINDAVVLAMMEAATRKKTTKDALEAAAETTRKVLKDAGYYK